MSVNVDNLLNLLLSNMDDIDEKLTYLESSNYCKCTCSNPISNNDDFENLKLKYEESMKVINLLQFEKQDLIQRYQNQEIILRENRRLLTQVSSLENLKISLEKEINPLKTELKKLEKENGNLLNQISILSDANNEHLKNISSLTYKLNSYKLNSENADTKILNLKNELDGKISQIDQLKINNYVLTKDLENSNSKSKPKNNQKNIDDTTINKKNIKRLNRNNLNEVQYNQYSTNSYNHTDKQNDNERNINFNNERLVTENRQITNINKSNKSKINLQNKNVFKIGDTEYSSNYNNLKDSDLDKIYSSTSNEMQQKKSNLFDTDIKQPTGKIEKKQELNFKSTIKIIDKHRSKETHLDYNYNVKDDRDIKRKINTEITHKNESKENNFQKTNKNDIDYLKKEIEFVKNKLKEINFEKDSYMESNKEVKTKSKSKSNEKNKNKINHITNANDDLKDYYDDEENDIVEEFLNNKALLNQYKNRNLNKD